MVLDDKRVKVPKKKDMLQNVQESITGNLDFVENSNFKRECTETAVCRCSGINSHENTHEGALSYQSYRTLNL